MAALRPLEPDLDFIRRLKAAGGESVKKCYQCATCSVACPLSPDDQPFPRKEMVWAQWGLKDRILGNPDIWLCYQCQDCSKLCPRDAKPGDVLSAARKMAFEHYAVPGFLGKALNNPSALIPLIAVPVALVAAVMFYGPAYNAWFYNQEGILQQIVHGSWFGRFFPLLAVDTLFVGTVTLMAVAMIMSLMKFWGDMKKAAPGTPTMDIVPAVVEAVKEVMFHRRFMDCGQAQPRRTPHLLLFWGMVALFVVTAIVFLALYFGQLVGITLHLPMGFENPVKWLALAGTAAFLYGLAKLWMNRSEDEEAMGTTAYQDQLFLWVLLIVGVTGLGAFVLRNFGAEPHAEGFPIPGEALPIAGFSEMDSASQSAIAVYFVHLASVWFLLGYLPYSKFAHMVYRTVALVYAFKVGRIEPPVDEEAPHDHDHDHDEEQADEDDDPHAHAHAHDDEEVEEDEGDDDHKAA